MSNPFIDMVQVLQPGESEHYVLEHFTVSKADADFHNLRALWQARGRASTIKPGDYCRLKEKAHWGDVVMSDTPYERITNVSAVNRAHGRMLIGGLGLGMILIPIAAKANVVQIDVIEKSPEVIGLVYPQLCRWWESHGSPATPLRVNVIEADMFEYKPAPGVLYDSIYFDIWPNVCSDNYHDMKRLHRSWGRRLNRKGNSLAWMDSWERDTCMWLGRTNY